MPVGIRENILVLRRSCRILPRESFRFAFAVVIESRDGHVPMPVKRQFSINVLHGFPASGLDKQKPYAAERLMRHFMICRFLRGEIIRYPRDHGFSIVAVGQISDVIGIFGNVEPCRMRDFARGQVAN